MQTIGFGYVTGGSSPAVEIGAQQTTTSGYTYSDIVLATRSSTSNVPPTERMRIDHNGYVGIGTPNPLSACVIANGGLVIGTNTSIPGGLLITDEPGGSEMFQVVLGNGGLTYVMADSAGQMNLEAGGASIGIGGFGSGGISIGGNSVSISVAETSWNWPSSDGASGYYLQTDGAGNLHWSNAGTSVGSIISINGSNASAQTINGSGLLFVYGGSSSAHTVGWTGLTPGDFLIANSTTTVICESLATILAGGAGGLYLGSNNTGVGVASFTSGISGTSNSGFGAGSLAAITSGSNNTALGYEALTTIITGSYNTAVGAQSLCQTPYSGSYNYNTAVGYGTFLYLNTANANNNVAIGYEAGAFHANGSTHLANASQSIYIGSFANGCDENDSNCIVIGYGASPATSSGSGVNSITIGAGTSGLGANTTVIGNSSTTLTKIFGKLNVGTLPTSPTGLTSGTLWSNSGVINVA
jgi:hypothetical protein